MQVKKIKASLVSFICVLCVLLLITPFEVAQASSISSNSHSDMYTAVANNADGLDVIINDNTHSIFRYSDDKTFVETIDSTGAITNRVETFRYDPVYRIGITIRIKSPRVVEITVLQAPASTTRTDPCPGQIKPCSNPGAPAWKIIKCAVSLGISLLTPGLAMIPAIMTCVDSLA